jgi:hypothetical protein
MIKINKTSNIKSIFLIHFYFFTFLHRENLNINEIY